MKTLEQKKQTVNKILKYKRIPDTAKEFLYKLYVGLLEVEYNNLEYHVQNEGKLYTFCYKVGEQKYEFCTDDYSVFREVKRIADKMVL